MDLWLCEYLKLALSRNTACRFAAQQRPFAEDQPPNRALVLSQQHFLKHLKSQRKSYLKPKSNQPQNAPFCVHFFSTPSHYFIIVSFHETPSSHSHLFSPLSNDKTTLLSSEKEMSSWREVEGHTRRLIRYCSLLAILLKTIYPRPWLGIPPQFCHQA